jgi:hypothetical protein
MWVVVELSSEHLHPEQGEDHDEQEEEEQQGRNGLDRVEQ